MVTRLRITLEQDEYTALLRLAAEELRNPADQLRKILRQELEARDLLSISTSFSPSETLDNQSQEYENKGRTR